MSLPICPEYTRWDDARNTCAVHKVPDIPHFCQEGSVLKSHQARTTCTNTQNNTTHTPHCPVGTTFHNDTNRCELHTESIAHLLKDAHYCENDTQMNSVVVNGKTVKRCT